MGVATPPEPTRLPVRVIESPRRRRTIGARIVDGVIEVRVPANMTGVERDRHVDDLVERIERKRSSVDVDLHDRARSLAHRYDLPEPTSVVWSARQRSRWGSCTPADGSIRISDRLAALPEWVLDYVLVHELAHLREPGHGPAFHALVDRYPRAERARGFLDAVSLGVAGSPT